MSFPGEIDKNFRGGIQKPGGESKDGMLLFKERPTPRERQFGIDILMQAYGRTTAGEYIRDVIDSVPGRFFDTGVLTVVGDISKKIFSLSLLENNNKVTWEMIKNRFNGALADYNLSDPRFQLLGGMMLVYNIENQQADPKKPVLPYIEMPSRDENFDYTGMFERNYNLSPVLSKNPNIKVREFLISQLKSRILIDAPEKSQVSSQRRKLVLNPLIQEAFGDVPLLNPAFDPERIRYRNKKSHLFIKSDLKTE